METGATKAQIEAAVSARIAHFRDGDPTWNEFDSSVSQGVVEGAAKWLVPPTHRIVSVDDLKALLRGYEYDFTDREGAALIERMSALIEGA